MKEFLWHSPVRIQPVLGETPESFDAIYMFSSLWLPKFFSDHNMLAPNSQRCICMPIISVVKTPWLRVRLNKPDKLLITSPLYRENLDHSVSFENTKDNDLPCCTPSTLAFPGSAKHCFITFKRSFKGFSQFLVQRTASSGKTIKALDRRKTHRTPETLSIHRDSQHKHFQKPLLRYFWQTDRIPYTYNCVSLSAFFAFVSSIRKFIRALLRTFRTLFHIQTSLTLVRFAWVLPYTFTLRHKGYAPE